MGGEERERARKGTAETPTSWKKDVMVEERLLQGDHFIHVCSPLHKTQLWRRTRLLREEGEAPLHLKSPKETVESGENEKEEAVADTLLLSVGKGWDDVSERRIQSIGGQLEAVGAEGRCI